MQLLSKYLRCTHTNEHPKGEDKGKYSIKNSVYVQGKTVFKRKALIQKALPQFLLICYGYLEHLLPEMPLFHSRLFVFLIFIDTDGNNDYKIDLNSYC